VAFGKGLAYLRRSQGMSRMQLKVMAGLGNYPMLAEIEAGKRPPSDDTIDKLAKAFELSPAELVARCLRLDGGDS
jgi:transcriptional regulator with XRE-family HTH domain